MPIKLTITTKDRSTTTYDKVIGLRWNFVDPSQTLLEHLIDGKIVDTIIDARTIDTIKVEAVQLLQP